MIYIIRTAEELEILRQADSNYWLGGHMFRHEKSIIYNPVFKNVDGYQVIEYKDYYWHPETFRPVALEDIEDIVYISKEELKRIKD